MTMGLEDSGPLPQAASKDKLRHRSKSFPVEKTKGIFMSAVLNSVWEKTGASKL
jgi:hypothetical protein